MKTITIELPDELYARLCAVAEETGETVQELVVRLLTEWLAREEATAGEENAVDGANPSVRSFD